MNKCILTTALKIPTVVHCNVITMGFIQFQKNIKFSSLFFLTVAWQLSTALPTPTNTVTNPKEKIRTGNTFLLERKASYR